MGSNIGDRLIGCDLCQIARCLRICPGAGRAVRSRLRTCRGGPGRGIHAAAAAHAGRQRSTSCLIPFAKVTTSSASAVNTSTLMTGLPVLPVSRATSTASPILPARRILYGASIAQAPEFLPAAAE